MFYNNCIFQTLFLLCQHLFPVGIQNHKQDTLVNSYESELRDLGFEKAGNNYYLVDGKVKYDVYMFERPDTLKWNLK